MKTPKTDRRQSGKAVTEVEGFQQRSLFDHEQVRRLKKTRRPRERQEEPHGQ